MCFFLRLFASFRFLCTKRFSAACVCEPERDGDRGPSAATFFRDAYSISSSVFLPSFVNKRKKLALVTHVISNSSSPSARPLSHTAPPRHSRRIFSLHFYSLMTVIMQSICSICIRVRSVLNRGEQRKRFFLRRKHVKVSSFLLHNT